MSQFARSLKNLLRLRESLERQQETVLARTNFQLAGVQRHLADEAGRRRAERADLLHALTAECPAGELQVAAWQWDASVHRERVLRERETRLEAERVLHCEALLQKTRDRKLIESLRLRHLEAAAREHARREQSAADDAFARARHSPAQY